MRELQDDTVACCLSQHKQNTGTTTKPRMKGKIYFHYLIDWRIPQAAPSRGTYAGMQALWILVHPRGSLNLLFLPVYQGFV